MLIPMGQYDSPQSQEQPVFYLNLYKSNIAVFGLPMSGKTTFIKTLLVQLHKLKHQLPGESTYIIDFGGNIGKYGKLGNVCACFDNSNEENIKRVFRTIEKRVSDNARKLQSQSYFSALDTGIDAVPAHITLIIENINTFLADERYASYQERLMRFCRDGLSKGLTVVLTANDLSGINRLMANFGQKVAFEMPSDSYYEIFNAKVSKPMKLPGRGLINIDSSTYEFQAFIPFATLKDESAIDSLILQHPQNQNTYVMASFADTLTESNFAEFSATKKPLSASEPPNIVVGLEYYEHSPVAVNITECRSIAIYGKRQFGKTNLLALLLNGIKQYVPAARYVFFDDGRKQLLPFHDVENEQSVYLSDISSLRDYLSENGYGAQRRPGYLPNLPRITEVADTPFTVFIFQSKVLYRNSPEAKYLMTQWLPVVIGDAEARKCLFIFSDVASISEADMRVPFNDDISVAFLLDSIGEFVSEKGSKSVFGEMDAKELKTEYAKCSVGDGYIYNTETDILQKLKFIKVE